MAALGINMPPSYQSLALFPAAVKTKLGFSSHHQDCDPLRPLTVGGFEPCPLRYGVRDGLRKQGDAILDLATRRCRACFWPSFTVYDSVLVHVCTVQSRTKD